MKRVPNMSPILRVFCHRYNEVLLCNEHRAADSRAKTECEERTEVESRVRIGTRECEEERRGRARFEV